MYSAVTGGLFTLEDLLKTAERVINMERMINCQYGFTRDDDKLPSRLLNTPSPDGVGEGQTVNMEAALDSYYGSMGWDIQTGTPGAEKLQELHLGWMM